MQVELGLRKTLILGELCKPTALQLMLGSYVNAYSPFCVEDHTFLVSGPLQVLLGIVSIRCSGVFMLLISLSVEMMMAHSWCVLCRETQQREAKKFSPRQEATAHLHQESQVLPLWYPPGMMEMLWSWCWPSVPYTQGLVLCLISFQRAFSWIMSGYFTNPSHPGHSILVNTKCDSSKDILCFLFSLYLVDKDFLLVFGYSAFASAIFQDGERATHTV